MGFSKTENIFSWRQAFTVLQLPQDWMENVLPCHFIGLTRSEKTSLMTTPKRPGAHFWQICPLSIDHRCLEYHYTKLGRSNPPIKYSCLEYCYTKLGRSTGRSTPQSSIDALHTATPNMADILADLPSPSIDHRCLEYCYTTLGRSTPINWP